MTDHLPAITALRDIAAHLERNPSLPTPQDVSLERGQDLRVLVAPQYFQTWRDTAIDIGLERITETIHGYHAYSAVTLGSTAVTLTCFESSDMTRQAFALLVGFGYSTPTRQAV